MPVGLHSKKINVESYEDLRDSISSSGVFDMTDCAVEIGCPEDSDVSEVQKMVHLIESMVHVTDIQISSTHENFENNYYTIKMTETPNNPKTRFIRGRGEK